MYNFRMINPNSLITFLKKTFAAQHVANGVIAVSGGIDSAVSLTLLTQALSSEHVFPLLLPYGNQNMDDARAICIFNKVPQNQWQEMNIQPAVDAIADLAHIEKHDHMRLGNVMARVRMILVYDAAKKHHALVCGTENKSEHYLGYFTRFGDSASDVEPLTTLYKTDVRMLAEQLQLPSQFLSKQPSAGLWENQTDEQELGFTYEDADKVLRQLIDEHKEPEHIHVQGIDAETISRICARVKQQAFKYNTPYTL